jgi:hypothetical protein
MQNDVIKLAPSIMRLASPVSGSKLQKPSGRALTEFMSM